MKQREIRLNGEAIRRGRSLRGWSEADLGEKAGLAARTVRNAEIGAPVKLHVAYDVADALGVGVKDLILDLAELERVEQDHFEIEQIEKQPRLNWQAIAAAIEAVLEGAESGADEQLLALAHPRMVLRCEATSPLPFVGEFQGLEGVTEYANRLRRWLDERRIVGRKFAFERVERDGDVLVMRGNHSLRWENGATGDYWFAHFIRLEGNQIVAIEQFVGM